MKKQKTKSNNCFFIDHLKCIVKQLLDLVFVICKIINVCVRVISHAFGSNDNSYLDIDNYAYITLHRINVYFISHLDNSIIIYICNMSLNSSPCIDRSLFCIFIIICITLYFLFMQAQFKQMNLA